LVGVDEEKEVTKEGATEREDEEEGFEGDVERC
jgi:hypothetical protein